MSPTCYQITLSRNKNDKFISNGKLNKNHNDYYYTVIIQTVSYSNTIITTMEFIIPYFVFTYD